MGFITKDGLKQLLNYKYKPGEYTMLDNLMNIYWEACVKLVPKWVAPNVLTFMGWILVIASYANMLRYDYTFKKILPDSAFFFASFCIFAYSTLDAIDGKQAKRTKSGSPLGQLFDHGCDSFSLAFFVLGICQATLLEKDDIFLIFIVSQIAFYTSNWAQHHTGVLRTSVGQFGVTEAEYTLVIVQFLTGIYGQNMWKISLSDLLPSAVTSYKSLHPLLEYVFTEQIGPVIVRGFAVTIAISISVLLFSTLKGYSDKKRAISQFLGIVLIAIMELTWSSLEIYSIYNGLILVNFGVMASLLISKLIICSVTKMKFQVFHFELIPLILSTIAILYLDLIGASLLWTRVVFWCCFAADVAIVMTFLSTTIRQMTRFLGIECFTLKKVQPKMD